MDRTILKVAITHQVAHKVTIFLHKINLHNILAPLAPCSTVIINNTFVVANEDSAAGNGFQPPRGGFRGRGHFQNLHWNANGQNGAGRGQHSGNATPQHGTQNSSSPPVAQPASQQASPRQAPSENAEDDDNLFRPSKDLQVEDTPKKTNDEAAMPPPSRPTPTGPQSNKFSFAFKASAKAPVAAPKPEISQKLNVGPFQRPQPSTSVDHDRGHTSSRPNPNRTGFIKIPPRFSSASGTTCNP